MNDPYETNQIVLAESYPAISYAVALEPTLPCRKLIIAKTKQEERKFAIELLRQTRWIAENNVSVDGLNLAVESEDSFDALMACAALLRCLVESHPIAADDASKSVLIDTQAEGGILLSSWIDFDQKGKRLKAYS